MLLPTRPGLDSSAVGMLREYDPVSRVALFASIPLNMTFTNSAKLAMFLPARSASC